jgi:hypothetical protein
MVSNATFNNISAIMWRSVLSVEEIGVSGENHKILINITDNLAKWFSPTIKNTKHNLKKHWNNIDYQIACMNLLTLYIPQFFKL